MPEDDENDRRDDVAAVEPLPDSSAAQHVPAPSPDSAAPQSDSHGEQAHAVEPSAPTAADAALVEGVSGGVSWVPFAVYLGAWLVLSGLSAYFLRGATAAQPARWIPEYEPLLWTGVGLAAAGPVLSFVVWLVARARRDAGARRGLFASVMTRGATATFFGVLLWIGTLFVLEQLASGWTL